MKRPPPESLAGFQLLCNSEIRVGDILVAINNPGKPLCYAHTSIGKATDEDGGYSIYRVYRRIPVAHPGACDFSPSTGKPFEVSTPEVHHSDPAPRACERAPEVLQDIPGATVVLDANPLRYSARTALPTTAADRKGIPIATGCLDYFPDAIAAVARLSKVGNDQHNPSQPLHWDKSKSTDEADALVRHLLDRGTIDTDGQRHSAKVAWRALALLQREIESERAGGAK
jgi:hypothetical protein